MHWIDTSIIILFLFGLMGFGWWQSRLNKSSADYFLGGKNIPWVVAMFSIVATETSVLTFISIPGIAYRGNWFFSSIGDRLYLWKNSSEHFFTSKIFQFRRHVYI